MDLDFDLNSSKAFILNLQAIESCQEYPSFVRLLAARLQKNSVMSIEYFFQVFLTGRDFEELNRISNLAYEKDANKVVDNPEYEILLLLVMMLTNAEGTFHFSDDERAQEEILGKYVSVFVSMIACVSLNRQGLVEIMWENASFSEECQEKPFVKRKF